MTPPEPAPALHAEFSGSRLNVWCDTGLRRPESIAPASSVSAIGRAGAPEEVVSILEHRQTDTLVTVEVPVAGTVRLARVPGVRLSIADALPLASTVAEHDSPAWAGPSVRAFSALSRAVARFVSAGYVAPIFDSDGESHAGWFRLVRTPDVSEWLTQNVRRLHGLVRADERVDRLLDLLADAHAKEAIRRYDGDEVPKRSALGLTLTRGGELVGADSALPAVSDDFARALAASSVECVLRVIEPDPSEDEGETLWCLEVLVRVGDHALTPFSALPGREALVDTVTEILDRAGRFWPPLAEASRGADGIDPVVSTETILDLVESGVEALRPSGVEVLLPRAWTRVTTKVKAEVRGKDQDGGVPPVDNGTRLGIDELGEVSWELLVDETPVSDEELQRLATEAGDLVRLRGQWVRADGEALRRAAKFLLDRRGERGTAFDFVRALSGEDAETLDIQAPAEWPQRRDADTGSELPPWFAAELRAYQADGVAWLVGRARAGAGAILADDMGLGKTIQVLALEATERHGGDPGPTLVVAPLSLVANWDREVSTFAPELTTHVHHGAGRLAGDEAVRTMEATDLVLSTYGTVTRDASLLATVRWRRVVADEAQAIKNPETRTAAALRGIPAEQRIALSGTPVENRLEELRAILEFVNPGLLGSASTFRARFAAPIEGRGDERAAKRLRALTAPFVLRRTKHDRRVAPDLPDKIFHTINAPLTREQAALYSAIVDEMLEAVAGKQGVSRKGAIFAGLTSLKQVCNHPAHYLADGSGVLRGGRHRSGKLAELENLLAQIRDSGESALVFTQYRAFGELILPTIARWTGRDVAFLHGGVTPRDRAAMVADFQAGDGPDVMLASLKAGGTGLTLTRANHVLHLDRWWNPAVENQATDRVHRIGQDRTVEVHTFVSRGTVEDRIDRLIDTKSALADLTIGPLAGHLTELDDAALASVLQLDDNDVSED